MTNTYTKLLAVLVTCAACAPNSVEMASTPSPASTPPVAPATASARMGLGAAGTAPLTAAPAANVSVAPAMPSAATPAPAASATPKNPEAAPPAATPPSAAPPPVTPAAATPPAMAPANPANAATGGASAADKFCDKYGEHCGYGMMNRHADRAACITDFNASPAQQACKNMHLDTAIAGTAAACNGMPSAFCFAIHCLHAAGITDPTGVTYCK